MCQIFMDMEMFKHYGYDSTICLIKLILDRGINIQISNGWRYEPKDGTYTAFRKDGDIWLNDRTGMQYSDDGLIEYISRACTNNETVLFNLSVYNS